MSATYKPCPFCGAAPEVDAMDRLIVIKCGPCSYQRAFNGILQSKESDVRVSELEFYHRDADDKARDAWNQRVQP